MVNIAYSDCSADGNSGLRQVLLFFLEYFGSYEENQGECSSDKPLGGPYGGPKVPPGPFAEKNFNKIEKFKRFFFFKVFFTIVDLGKSEDSELFGPHF